MSAFRERLNAGFPAVKRNQADLGQIERAESFRTISPNITNPRPEIPPADAERFKKIDPGDWPF